MKEKRFEQALKEIQSKRILVANRGVPSRNIVRSINELKAVPILTATYVDKTAPFASWVNDLLLFWKNPRAYLDVD